MARFIKIKCNGSGKHINEVDLEKVVKKDTVLRIEGGETRNLPDRIVLDCRQCTSGKLIITRKMLEANL